MPDQCPKCGSYNTYTWNGTDGHSEPQSVFECYGCNLIIENGEIIQSSKLKGNIGSASLSHDNEGRDGSP